MFGYVENIPALHRLGDRAADCDRRAPLRPVVCCTADRSSRATGQVLFFEANWCGVCRSMQPVVKQLRGEGFSIRTLDVDRHQKQATDYDIHSIPAFVLVRDGQEVAVSLVLFRLNRFASFGDEQASSAEYILHFRRAKSRA